MQLTARGHFRGMIVIAALMMLLLQTAWSAPRKSAASSKPAGDWKKLTSSSGAAKSTPKYVKFQPTTSHFRVRLNAGVAVNAGPSASAATIRVALMSASALDIDGKPTNWMQLDTLVHGEPNVTITKEFDGGGADQNGVVKWFAIQITGQAARYEVTIEQLEGKPKGDDVDPKDDSDGAKGDKPDNRRAE